MMSSAKAIPEKLTGYILYIQGSGGRRYNEVMNHTCKLSMNPEQRFVHFVWNIINLPPKVPDK